MTHNFATPEATHKFLSGRGLHPEKLRTFDSVTLSALAVGTYLGDSNEAVDRLYEDALVHAAHNGVNFFDTAINYRCQRSERNIAYALKKLAGLGVSRASIFVSTKGGFLPAEGSPEGFREYIYKCYLNTGIITPEDIVANCHCMTPKYLESQINLSLSNLKLDTIDLYYLHNPETQLKETSRDVFYERLTRAFELFERKVDEGKIKRYGIATWNGLRTSPGAPDLIEIDRVLACARAAGGDKHRFRAIQLPYNLAMLEAVGIPNQKARGEVLPIIPAAVDAGLGVFVSAPLMQSQVAQLPRGLFDTMPGEGTAIQKALQFVTSAPGVVSAMVGMKTRTHVDENRATLSWPVWEVSELQNIAKKLVRAAR